MVIFSVYRVGFRGAFRDPIVGRDYKQVAGVLILG